MSARMIVLETIAVIVGAVIGLLVVDIFAWAFFNTAIFGMVASIGRWIVILFTVALFAFYYRQMPPTAAAIASFFTGVGLPLIAEKIIFGSSLPMGSLLFLFVVFAVVALFTYRFAHANAVVGTVANDVAGPDDTRHR